MIISVEAFFTACNLREVHALTICRSERHTDRKYSGHLQHDHLKVILKGQVKPYISFVIQSYYYNLCTVVGWIRSDTQNLYLA